MKTNEKICKKCRKAYYKGLVPTPGNWGSMISRSEIVTEGCAPLLHGQGEYNERQERWWNHEVAEDCPYLLELTLLQENTGL